MVVGLEEESHQREGVNGFGRPCSFVAWSHFAFSLLLEHKKNEMSQSSVFTTMMYLLAVMSCMPRGIASLLS